MNTINDDSRGFGSQAFKGDNFDDADDPEADDSNLPIALAHERLNAAESRKDLRTDSSPMTIKVVQLPPKSKLSFSKQKQTSKREEGQAPSDERENEERVQYKHLKSFGPASHSRYVNDDS